MDNQTVTTQSISNADAMKQLEAIKAKTADVVRLARQKDPNIKINEIDAQKIGIPKVSIPTEKTQVKTPPELNMVGTTPVPKTGMDVAREAILSQVPESDRATIQSILDISTGLQTEQGAKLEGDLQSLTQQRLDLAQSKKDRQLEMTKMSEAQQLPSLQAELESIRSEADVLEARRNSAVQAESRREGVSTAARAGNVDAINRDFNLEKANLAIRELASVGKINAATKLIDTTLDLKYGDLEAETNLVTEQMNAILPLLSREDAKIAETRLMLNEQVKTTIADAKEKDKQLYQFKLQSYQFAQQNGASPAVLSQIMSATSMEDVMSVGGTMIQDPMRALNLEQARLQIAALKAPKVSAPTQDWTMFNQADGTTVMYNQKTGEIKPAGSATGVTGSAEKAQATVNNLDSLLSNVKEANTIAKSGGFFRTPVGPSGLTQALGDFLIGNTSYRQLENIQNTLKTNMLTMNTDPNIKKYFGPQMTENDTKLMMAAGSTLDAKNQTVPQFTNELSKYENMIKRAKTWTVLGQGGNAMVTLIDPQTGIKKTGPVDYQSLENAINSGVTVVY